MGDWRETKDSNDSSNSEGSVNSEGLIAEPGTMLCEHRWIQSNKTPSWRRRKTEL